MDPVTLPLVQLLKTNTVQRCVEMTEDKAAEESFSQTLLILHILQQRAVWKITVMSPTFALSTHFKYKYIVSLLMVLIFRFVYTASVLAARPPPATREFTVHSEPHYRNHRHTGRFYFKCQYKWRYMLAWGNGERIINYSYSYILE